MNECLQSIRLIYSCLKTMKSSRYNTDLGDHMQVMESMINCFKLSTEALRAIICRFELFMQFTKLLRVNWACVL